MRDLFGDLMTDHRFLLGSLELAQRVTANNGMAFVYQFDWSGPNSPWRACHCIELPFTFGTLPAWDAPMLLGLEQETYQGLSGTMMAAWCAFAHGGNPSTPRLAWPTYGPGRETMYWITRRGDGGPGGPRVENRRLMAGRIPVRGRSAG